MPVSPDLCMHNLHLHLKPLLEGLFFKNEMLSNESIIHSFIFSDNMIKYCPEVVSLLNVRGVGSSRGDATSRVLRPVVTALALRHRAWFSLNFSRSGDKRCLDTHCRENPVRCLSRPMGKLSLGCLCGHI